MSKYLFTSESVTEGHPDKICDKISDSLLDAYLEQDPKSRVAVETMVKTGFVVCGGEVTSKAVIEIPKIVLDADPCEIGDRRRGRRDFQNFIGRPSDGPFLRRRQKRLGRDRAIFGHSRYLAILPAPR